MQLIYCKFYYTTYHLIYTLYLEDNRIVGNKSSNLLHSITQLAHSDKLEKNHIPPIDPVLYIFTQEGVMMIVFLLSVIYDYVSD